MTQAEVIPFRGRYVASMENSFCNNCSVKELCLPAGLDEHSLSLIDEQLKQINTVEKDEVLFKPGDRFNKLFVVRSGSVKTFLLNNKHELKIVNFNLPGEILGFDAIESEFHKLTAVALETSSICCITFKDLFSLAAKIQPLQHRLLKLASRYCDYHHHIKLDSSATERVAFFLLDLSSRFKRRGFSAVKFSLSMSRGDIANYLGLTIETTSRTFSKLQKEKVIHFDKRYVEILNLRQLQLLAC